MLVTWPFVMLLLDYWPLGRFVSVVGHRAAMSPDIFRDSTLPTSSREGQ